MATTAADIQELYIAYFGRPADPAGLTYWIQVADQQGLLKTANFFGTTPEYAQRVGSLTVQQAINSFYVNLYGRQAEPEGLLFWTNKVQTGVLSLEDVGYYIATQNSPADAAILGNKVTSSEQWTTSLNTTDEILAYDTATGQQAGISFLKPFTTTAATEAETTAAITAMTAASGGGSSGVTFNQIAGAGAVLTNNANTNAAGLGAGFTPSASFLTNANDIIKFGAFGGATVQDTSSTDNDTLLLDATGFAMGAAAVAGIENYNFNGAASFAAGNIGGVKNVTFNRGSRFLGGFTQVGTANILVNTTDTVGLIGGGVTIGSVAVSLGNANGGTLSLNATTALSVTNVGSANSTYTLAYTAGNGGSGSLAFLAGSANTSFSLNINQSAGVAVQYSAATFSAGGDFRLTIGSTANAIGAGFANLNSAIISFATTGAVRVVDNGNLAANASLNHLGWSGVSAWQFATTAGGGGFDFSAAVPLKNGAVDLSFGTAQGTQAIIFNDGGLNTLLDNGNRLSLGGVTGNTAFFATGASDTVNLTFNTLSGLMLMSGGGIRLSVMGNTQNGFTAFTANLGIEVLTLNIFGGPASADHQIQAVTNSTATNTFNLNASQGVSFSLSAAARASTSLTTFGFSGADGNNTISVTTGWNSGPITFVDGSGNSFISLNNLAVAQAQTANLVFGASYSAYGSQLNTINVTDGGSDTISLGGNGSAATSAFARAQIVGLNAGDVLSFTNYTAGTLASFVVATGFNGIGNAGFSAITLIFDGTDTFVFQLTSASLGSATDAANNQLAAVLKGGNYASLSRWSLNANNLVLNS